MELWNSEDDSVDRIQLAEVLFMKTVMILKVIYKHGTSELAE
jgi:hypothetical protein